MFFGAFHVLALVFAFENKRIDNYYWNSEVVARTIGCILSMNFEYPADNLSSAKGPQDLIALTISSSSRPAIHSLHFYQTVRMRLSSDFSSTFILQFFLAAVKWFGLQNE